MTVGQNLLADYASTGSESAFCELVSRYLNLVFSAALRLVNMNSHLAEDVAQTVFFDLAKTARMLPRDVMLGGWLHRHTCFVAANMMRAERRRQLREQRATAMNLTHQEPRFDFADIGLLLDEAINELGNQDRVAILLRFFEQLEFRAIGDALGTSEDAAKKRVNRALGKLHGLLTARGVSLSVGGLTAGLAAQAVTAAPAHLVSSIAAGALAGCHLTWTELLIMYLSKKTALLILGVATVCISISFLGEQRRYDTLLAERTGLASQLALAESLRASNERIRSAPPTPEAEALLAKESEARQLLRSELMRLRAKVGSARRADREETSAELADKLIQREMHWEQVMPDQLEFIPVEPVSIVVATAHDQGCATPEAALESWLWAARQPDEQSWLSLKYTSDYQAAWKLVPKIEGLEKQVADREAKDFDALKRAMERVISVRLHTKEMCGDGQVRLWFDVERAQRNQGKRPYTLALSLKLVGSEWKVRTVLYPLP